MNLLVFTTSPSVAAHLPPGTGVIVDWERRGKVRRQAGEGTQINHDTPADLAAVRAATDRPVLCRVNGAGRWTAREIDLAIECGANEVLLPMVRGPRDVEVVLEAAAGRCGVGILIETQAAVQQAEALASLPLSRVYVGLNDLRIDRRSKDLFAPLADGTVDEVRQACGPVPFGVAGLTLPECGAPIPSRLLAGELARLGASFTFLRRSFHADRVGMPLEVAVSRIARHCAELAARPPDAVAADRAALLERLTAAAVSPAA